MLERAPVGRVDIVQVLGEFPALALWVGDEGLAQPPGLIGGLIDDPAAVVAGTLTCCDDVLDEHQRDSGCFTEAATASPSMSTAPLRSSSTCPAGPPSGTVNRIASRNPRTSMIHCAAAAGSL
ncbi:MAG: hypothetical protein ABIZ05_10615 [Pseudonocardiaceae bacterium]